MHKYVLSKSKALKRNVPTVAAVERILDGSDKSGSSSPSSRRKGKKDNRFTGDGDGADTYNARAVRHSMRVFVTTGVLMRLWRIVEARMGKGKKE